MRWIMNDVVVPRVAVHVVASDAVDRRRNAKAAPPHCRRVGLSFEGVLVQAVRGAGQSFLAVRAAVSS